ncbi:Ig-like domain-containing protein, partial [Methanosphaera sp.]|uniref:Ig-like domain-containing protein n=1 Tax=Methanosphaera sp. TaxID=2666342 RepID=UPI002E764E4D
MFVALSFILLIISTSSATENNITTENHEQTEFDKYQETLEQNNIENKEISYNTITKQKTDNVKESDGNDENTDKIDTQVSIDSLNVGKYNENVTISGKFTEINGKTISNSNVKIIINGKKYFSRTDTTGTYNFTNKITAVGTNNLTVGYSGNIKYNPYETNTTFNVEKQDIIVTHNPIEDTLYKNNITITGKFTDANEKIITNSNVKIIINGIKYYAKTDTTGTYNFTYETNTLGTNNVTIGYSGNDKY